MNNRCITAHYENNIFRYFVQANPTDWWKNNAERYPRVAKLARCIYVHPQPPFFSCRTDSELTAHTPYPRTCEYVDFHEQEHIDGPVISNVCPGSPCRQLFNSLIIAISQSLQ